MTVTTSVNKIIHTGDAVQVDFTYNFVVLEESHMNVYLDGVLEDTANWSIVGLGDQAGGTVTMTSAPAAGVKVTLLRIVPNSQLVDYSAYGSFPAETHERALDLRVMEAQQIAEETNRALKAPLDDPGAFDYSLPTPVAGKGWKINGTGDAIILTTNDPDEQEALAAAQVALATTQANNAATSAGNAATAQTAAELAETNAETAQTAAELAETNAETAQTAAELAETNSEAWAEGTEPGGVGTKSSKEWAASAAASLGKADSLTSVLLPTSWEAVNKAGWDHFGFNQQWGGAPWGGRLTDGTDGEVATGYFKTAATTTVGGTIVQKYEMGFKVPVSGVFKAIILPFFSKDGNPTDSAEVNVYADSAGSPGALVTNGTASVLGETISSSGSETLFTFAAPISLTSDTLYHFEITRSGANSDVNLYRVSYSPDNDYPFGDTQYWGGASWITSTSAICFKLIPTAATATIRDGKFYASDTAQLGQAPALTKSIKDHIKRDKDGKFSHQFKVGAAPTASKPLCQAYYDNDTHITVETDASQHAVIRSNGSTITGTSVLTTADSVAFAYDGTQLHLYINGIEEGTAITVSYPDDFDTGTFIVGGAIPTDLTWTKETDMSLLPSADGWTYTGTATEANAFSVSGGKLYQNAAGYASTDTGYYLKSGTFSNATGWCVSTKLQVLNSPSGANNVAAYLAIQDGTKRGYIAFNTYFVMFYDGTNHHYIQWDFTKESTVRMLGKGDDVYLFINGKLAFDGTGLLLDATAVNQATFGDIASSAGENADVIWHYVNYIESYEAPTFTTTPLYDFGSWQKDASSLLVDLAASDVKSITGLKRDWVVEAERVISKGGITISPSTASLSLVGVPDLSSFVLAHSLLDAHLILTAKNSVAGNQTHANIQVNGDYSDTNDMQHESGSINDRGNIVVNAQAYSPGLSFVQPVWLANNSGTSVSDGVGRTSKVVTK